MSTFPTNPALEAAIIAHADEDTPRLAYADWLDENGDPDRAAFIRVQCRLAEMPPSDPEWAELDVQQDELVRRLADRVSSLLQPVPSPRFFRGAHVPEVILKDFFHRGFPSLVMESGHEASTDPKRHTADLAGLFNSTTYRDLSIGWIAPERFAELCDVPCLGQLRGLTFNFTSNWNAASAAACESAYAKFMNAPVAKQLRKFDLGSCPARVIPALAESTGFPALRRLSFNVWRAAPADLPALTAAKWLHGVWQLCLHFGSGDRADTAFPGVGEWPELHTLELRMPETQIEHLAAGRFPNLASLSYPNMGIMLRGLQRLLAAPWFSQLRGLDLTSSELGDRAATALAAHPVAKSLRVLRIGNNPIGKKGLLALATGFPELVRLDLQLVNETKRKATESDLTEFLTRLGCPRLRSLNLERLPVGYSGAKAIATNPALGGLRELRLGKDIPDRGLKALRAAKHLQQTRIL